MNQDIEARKQELLKEGYEEVYTRTKVLTDAVMHYCPGTASSPRLSTRWAFRTTSSA